MYDPVMKMPLDPSWAPGDCCTLFFACTGVSGFGVSDVDGAVPLVCGGFVGRLVVGAVVPFVVEAAAGCGVAAFGAC